ACGSTNQCQPGLTCMDGACKPFCLVDGDCTGTGRSCAQVHYGSFPVPKFLVCTSACDPVNPTAICGLGLSCFGTGRTPSDCVGPVGAGVGPSACAPGMPAACAPGYVCAGQDCLKWCRMTMNDCAPGQTCTTLPSGAVTLGGTSYGGCQ